jgi:hypothetical protein
MAELVNDRGHITREGLEVANRFLDKLYLKMNWTGTLHENGNLRLFTKSDEDEGGYPYIGLYEPTRATRDAGAVGRSMDALGRRQLVIRVVDILVPHLIDGSLEALAQSLDDVDGSLLTGLRDADRNIHDMIRNVLQHPQIETRTDEPEYIEIRNNMFGLMISLSEIQARIILQRCVERPPPDCPDPALILQPLIEAFSEKIGALNNVHQARIGNPQLVQAGGSDIYRHKYLKYKTKYNQRK